MLVEEEYVYLYMGSAGANVTPLKWIRRVVCLE